MLRKGCAMKGKRKIIKNLSRIIVFIVGVSMMAMSLTALANDYYTDDLESILEDDYEYDEDILNDDEDDDDEKDDNEALCNEGAPEEDDAIERSSDSQENEVSGAIAAFGSSLPVSAPPTPIGSITAFDPFTPWVIPQHFTFEEIALWGADTIVIRDLTGNPIGEMPITAGMLSGLDTSIPGLGTIIITLVVNGQSFSTTQPVFVDPDFDIICDCLNPVPTLFVIYFQTMFVGTTLTDSGIQAIVLCTYEDLPLFWCWRHISVGTGTAVTADMICSFPSNIPGPHTLTINYLGATGTIDVYFVAPNLGSDPKLHFPGDYFFLLPGNTIESLNIFGFLKTDDHEPACYVNMVCACPVLCMQFFTVTTEMALAGGFDPRLRGPQDITITFLGVTGTITLEVLGPPVCVCPPGCCGGDDCCGIGNECGCECRCPIQQPQPPNRDALREAIRNADAIERGRHTAATWNAFIAALERAQAVYDNPNATQAEINAAKLALLEAKEDLQKYPIGQNNQGNVTAGVSPRTGDMVSVLPLLAGFLLSMSSILGGTSLRRKLKK